MNAFPIVARKLDKKIPESEALYMAYLVPDKVDLLRLGIDEVLAQKIIYRVIDGGETTVTAGKPIPYNFLELINEFGIDLSPLIKLKLETHDFHLLRLSCAFISHTYTPHPFVWGEMRLKFSNGISSDEPIAYDLCPLNVKDPVKVIKEYGLSPSLEFKGISVSTDQIFRKVVEFPELVPIIVPFGKQTSEAGWIYKKTNTRKDISGTYDGFIILMSPKGAKVKVTVDVKAKINENFWGRVVGNFSKKWTQEDFRNMPHDKKVLDIPLNRAIPITEKERKEKRWKEEFAELLLSRQELSEVNKSISLP